MNVDEALLQQLAFADEKGLLLGDRISSRVGEGVIVDPGTGFRKGMEDKDWHIFQEYAGTANSSDPWEELTGLICKKRKDVRFLILSSRPYSTAVSKTGLVVRPCLDDLAQIVGTSLRCAPSPENPQNRKKILTALKGRSAVLLQGLGILAVAGSLEDAVAVCEIAEKSCKVFVESSYLGGSIRIPYPEALLMRFVYRKKYATQDEKNKASLVKE